MSLPNWPQLRHELALFEGPARRDGSPTWSIKDPVRNLFFAIDWTTFEVLSRWHFADLDMIIDHINQETTLHIDNESIEEIINFIVQNELVVRDGPESIKWLSSEKQRRKSSKLVWLIKNYLFFRVPLVKPDAWLKRNINSFNFFFTKQFFVLTLFALFIGLSQILQQWEYFIASLVDFFSLSGLIMYSVTMVVVKTCHELGHAFMAKRYGCKVPTMGVAFLVMFPMAYTDVNDVWKLTSKKQRLKVGAAGIITELSIAAWATLLWALLPFGMLRDACFLLATTTWVSTLLINASPFMRFDGYFLAMDALEIPNLHQRAFAQAKWWLREFLFDLNDAKPEYFSPMLTRGLILFGFGTWIYRLIVFSGIAVLVYYAFPKPLGQLLGLIEIGAFIIMPIYQECLVWFQRLEHIKANKRVFKWLGAIFFVLIMLVIPWDNRINGVGVWQPHQVSLLTAPGAASISRIYVQQGQQVDTGEMLVELASEDLLFELKAAKAQEMAINWQVNAAGTDNERRLKLGVLQAELERIRVKINSIESSLADFNMMAPGTGVVHFNNINFSEGQWLAKNELVLSLVSPDRFEVVAYFNEEDIARLRVGNIATFYPETAGLAPSELKVVRIDDDATHNLLDKQLASVYGGELMVREQYGHLYPERALYRVQFQSSELVPLWAQGLQTHRGSVVAFGDKRAWISKYFNSLAIVLTRELGF